MTTLCLTLKEPPAQRVDLSPLTAGHLTGKAVEDVAAIELATGNRKVRLDSLFAISGTFVSELEIRGSCDRLDYIAAGMTHGRIVVEGDAGAYLGAGMSGGSLVVHGNVGAYAATGMHGGRIHVYGSTGDFLAAARPGERHGMQGGLVLVDGDTGDRLGDRMRRGMVLIEGNAGDYCASRMVAGTIAVWGTVGKLPGLGDAAGDAAPAAPLQRTAPDIQRLRRVPPQLPDAAGALLAHVAQQVLPSSPIPASGSAGTWATSPTAGAERSWSGPDPQISQIAQSTCTSLCRSAGFRLSSRPRPGPGLPDPPRGIPAWTHR